MEAAVIAQVDSEVAMEEDSEVVIAQEVSEAVMAQEDMEAGPQVCLQ
jgi:hypothetical protein